MFKKKTIRDRIVEAARERFLHYGYGKTTMAEVASDCNMSPGNLYRYFPSKLDIAEEIVRRELAVHEERLRALVDQPDCGALTRLRNLLMEVLEATYRQGEQQPKLTALVFAIIRERPALSEEVLATEHKLIADLIREGNRTGEFAVDDPVFTSQIISAATTRFRYPQMRSLATLERLKRELNGVLDLLVNGMRNGMTSAALVGSGPDLRQGTAQIPKGSH